MLRKMHYGVGAHEPIFHRLRTGNSIAEEWERWEKETSPENLDLLEELGISHVHIACTKGFGLEYEKPLIERAAVFAEKANARGIEVSAYVQGFPVYYETFLLEVPEAENWLARTQNGDYIPWGGQTFRRWIDPTRDEFLEYQYHVFEYILDRFHPVAFGLDNTVSPIFYSDSARESFRDYLREKYDDKTALREFGIPSFDAVDLPHFDPVYFPPDAMKIVKDPMLQEWAYWRSDVTTRFCDKLRTFIRSKAPGVTLSSSSGCGGLRYNQLFIRGVDFEDRFTRLDDTHMEESAWRPGVIDPVGSRLDIIMDERHPHAASTAGSGAVRVSTNSRFMKIRGNYGQHTGGGFWGEFDRESKLVALAHGMTFAQNANYIGSVGPLAANPHMIDDIRDVIDWGNAHIDVLTGRGERVAPIAVWRGTVTIGFIRHRPVWEACVIEQMLYENHYPFTILLDGGLEKFLDGRDVLILPGTACVSDRQVDIITRFVDAGGKLLLLGEAGTRDERTRVRSRHAFEHLFGGAMPDLERIGPPHWVPNLDFSRMPDTLASAYGNGHVAFVKRIVPPHELDLTRDPYMPERQVMPKDIVPPKNESEILEQLDALYGKDSLKVDAPRGCLCEFWKRGDDLLVCLANLDKTRSGGPATIRMGRYSVDDVVVHTMLQDESTRLTSEAGSVTLADVDRFCAVECIGSLKKS